MYADELAGGTLFRGPRRVCRRAAPRRVPAARRSRRAPRRALGAPAAPSRRGATTATAAVPRQGAVLSRPPLRHRRRPSADAAHRGSRGRPLPRRSRGHRHDGAAGGGRRPHDRRDAGHSGGWPYRPFRGSPPRRHRRGAAGPVFGINDGLVSNFSLVMGVAGGTHDNSIVILAGVAGLWPARSRWRRASGFPSDRSASSTRTSSASSRKSSARSPRRSRGARADLPGEGHRARRGRALVDNIMRRNDVASTPSPGRSSGSIPASSAHRGSRRFRRSSPSRSARRSRSSRS